MHGRNLTGKCPVSAPAAKQRLHAIVIMNSFFQLSVPFILSKYCISIGNWKEMFLPLCANQNFSSLTNFFLAFGLFLLFAVSAATAAEAAASFSRLLSYVPCLTSPVSRFLYHGTCLPSPVSGLLSKVSCHISPVSRLLYWVFFLYTENCSELVVQLV